MQLNEFRLVRLNLRHRFDDRTVVVGEHGDGHGVGGCELTIGDGHFEDDRLVGQQLRRGERRRGCVRIVQDDGRTGDLRPRVCKRLTLGIRCDRAKRDRLVLVDGCVLHRGHPRRIVVGVDRDRDRVERDVRSVRDGDLEDHVGRLQQVGRCKSRTRGAGVRECDRRPRELRPRVAQMLPLDIVRGRVQLVFVIFFDGCIRAGINDRCIVLSIDDHVDRFGPRAGVVGDGEFEDVDFGGDELRRDEGRCRAVRSVQHNRDRSGDLPPRVGWLAV